ncbi:MAG: DUF3098 domain-containing protein [Rhodothermales bacterium]
MAQPTSSRRARQGRRQGAAGVDKRTATRAASKRNAAMVFTARNYLLMLLGVGLVVLGYVLMRMENEVDGFISLYVAPILLLGGYLEIIYAILWRPQNRPAPEETVEQA